MCIVLNLLSYPLRYSVKLHLFHPAGNSSLGDKTPGAVPIISSFTDIGKFTPLLKARGRRHRQIPAYPTFAA